MSTRDTLAYLDPGRSLSALERLLGRVESQLELSEKTLFEPVPAISGWSVAGHLFHLVLACDLSLRNVLSLARDEGRLVREPRERSEEGLAILRRGRIPPGAEAPRFVTPPARIDLALLGQLLGEIRTTCKLLLGDLDTLRAAPRCVPHQALGDLTLPEWLRFARAHTAHHLLIVREIRAALG